MLKQILLCFLLFSYTFATDNIFDIIDSSPSSRGDKRQKIGQEITEVINGDSLKFSPTDELYIPESQVYEKFKAKELKLKAAGIPEEVYVGQVFSMNITADTQSDMNFSFETSIDGSDINWLNQNGLKWTHIGNGIYSGTLFFQVNSASVKTIKIKLKVLSNDEIYQQKEISVFLPRIKEIDYDKNTYSHIVADDLVANSYRLKKFDESRSIVMIELRGKNINLRSFHIDNPNISRQDIDTINGTFNEQSAYYFAVIEGIAKNFTFSYFSLKENRIKTIEKSGLKLENDDVSTQVGINPQEGYFEFYKNMLIFALAGIFAFISIYKKKLIYVITCIFLILFGIYLYNPLNMAVLKADTNVMILPIASSTIFYKQDGRVQKGIKILNSTGDYYKIKFIKDGNPQVGWVRREDVTKN